MKTVNMHQAKTNLSRLVADVEKGGEFIIAKAGKPVAKVVPIHERRFKRTGFLEGQATIPDDFDTMFQKEIEDMFYNSPLFPDENPVK